MKSQNPMTVLSIEGMHCGSCVNKVTIALQPLCESVSVSLNPPVAKLNNANVNISKINKALALAGDYKASKLMTEKTAEATSIPHDKKNWLAIYQPLFLIIGYILITTLAINLNQDSFNAEQWMMHFMAGFFLVFSFFKMLNIKAFASSYAMYDLLAMRSKAYGFIYPFIELALGLAYLSSFEPRITNTATLVIMSFSSIGVIRAVMKKQKIRCACLGTVFELPMSTITIIEDLLMAGMAAWMLL
jgi:copper chaperone CopZ